MVTSAAMASFRSPQLMIAPLDTTAHLRKLQAPEQSDAPSWTLDSSVAPDPRPCSSPPKPASSSEAVVPVPPASGAPVSAGPSEASETWDDAFQSTSQPSSRTASSVKTRICSKCKEAKPFPSSYHRAGLNRAGLVTYRPDCVDCHRELDRKAKRAKRAAHRPKGGAAALAQPQHSEESARKLPKVVSLTAARRLDADADCDAFDMSSR